MPSQTLECCCGRQDCAYLEHNSATLDGLENDLHNAAQIGQVRKINSFAMDVPTMEVSHVLRESILAGTVMQQRRQREDVSLTFALQALLERHEAFVVEAEKQRVLMLVSIERVDLEKEQLEAVNKQTTAENRSLIEQLESLRSSLSESNAHVDVLEKILERTRIEVQRLTVLTSRTTYLESQLSAMELQQVTLQHDLTTNDEDRRQITHRWKRAEKTIESLQAQVDNMDKEAREQRERHVEVVAHLQEQSKVDRNGETAPGTLGGLATLSIVRRDDDGSSVVSHFVKDILQDNSNLQRGILELREMLLGSNQEIDHLREHILHHKPVPPVIAKGGDLTPHASMENDRKRVQSMETLPEVHVHHHYHQQETLERSGKDRSASRRNVRRKRGPIRPGSYATTSSSTPRPLGKHDLRSVTSIDTALSSCMVSDVPSRVIARPAHRLSLRSSQTKSSFDHGSSISSPLSPYQSFSVFDPSELAQCSSRPTTPGSSVHDYPVVPPRHVYSNETHPALFKNINTPSVPHCRPCDPGANLSPTLTANVNHLSSSRNSCLSVFETSGAASCSRSPHPISDASKTEPIPCHGVRGSHTRLQRASSHESLLSVSRMDFHVLHERPSQIISGQAFVPKARHGLISPTIAVTSKSNKPSVTPTTATGHSSFQLRAQDSCAYNRSLLKSSPTTDRSLQSSSKKQSLGERVGGWMWKSKENRPGASIATTSTVRAKVAPSIIDARVISSGERRHVRGFKSSNWTPIDIESVMVDTNLLKESLGE